MIEESLEEYHRQRDALLGRKADDLTPPATYTRGALPQEDKRGRRKSTFAVRVALTVIFFALWLFVWFFGLTNWSSK